MKKALLAAILALVCVLFISQTRNSKRSRTSNDRVQEPAVAMHSRPTGTQTRPADLASEIEKAVASQDAERQRVFESLLPALVELDPAAAAALLARIEPGPFREEYLLRLAQLWAARDAKAALEWASALPDAGERASTQQTICLEVAQTNPEAAIRTIESLKISDYKTSLDSMVHLWAAKDISAATAWAMARPEGEQRDGLLARVAHVMAEQNPVAAAELVVNNIHPGETQTEAAISIVHRWASQDWNSARRWVDMFPEGPLRQRAQNELTGIKAYADAQRQSRSAP